MPLTLDANIAGFLEQRTLYYVTCWQITRTDGTIHRFTDHDAELEVRGNTYTPTSGVDPSARGKGMSLSEDGVSVSGAVESSTISQEDLRAGRLRGAEVRELIVDWRFPWAGVIREDLYWVVSLEWDGEQWRADLEGITRRLRQRIGDTFTRACRYDLGRDRLGNISLTSGCKFDVASLTRFALSIDGVVAQRRIFTVSGSFTGEPDDWFNLGKITFQSGNNDGHVNQVGDWDQSSKTITLSIPAPFDIQVGDVVDIEPGCNKTTDHCVNKFDNIVNYGGFHLMPGADKALQAPQV